MPERGATAVAEMEEAPHSMPWWSLDEEESGTEREREIESREMLLLPLIKDHAHHALAWMMVHLETERVTASFRRERESQSPQRMHMHNERERESCHVINPPSAHVCVVVSVCMAVCGSICDASANSESKQRESHVVVC